MPPESEPLAGGCRCGAVRYQANSQPLHSMICHCKSCRLSASAPLVPWVTFNSDNVQFTGTRRMYKSSPGVERSFCPECGTPLSYRHQERPNELDITTCSLDEPEKVPPQNDSWVADELLWMNPQAVDQRPRFHEFRPDTAGDPT